jgi:hypothetical protein
VKALTTMARTISENISVPLKVIVPVVLTIIGATLWLTERISKIETDVAVLKVMMLQKQAGLDYDNQQTTAIRGN